MLCSIELDSPRQEDWNITQLVGVTRGATKWITSELFAAERNKHNERHIHPLVRCVAWQPASICNFAFSVQTAQVLASKV